MICVSKDSASTKLADWKAEVQSRRHRHFRAAITRTS
jgi:hypothetical protein